jgi:ABC-type lipoprotein release transport system permease subunit
MQSMLLETSAYDVGVVAGVTATLAVVAIAAAALPAWRAARVNPGVTLQAE